MLFSDNPKQLSEFYKKVFDKEPEWTEGDYYGFQTGNTMITIGPHDKVHGKNVNPERIMFNFETDDVKHEYERIKDIPARIIAEPYQPNEAQNTWIATFADPDGNFFQLISPWKE